MKLRSWQEQCINEALTFYQTQKHFFCLATPASGKTVMSAMLAKLLIEKKLIDYVICFSPSVTVNENLKNTFASVLGSRFDGLIGSAGCSYTYQSIRTISDEYLQLLEESRILLVFDEIHHCAGDSHENANSWGKGILERLKDRAAYTLSLSGTPWRSDRLPITLARYSGSIVCHYQYGLAQAINDGVCRKPTIVLVDNKSIKVKQTNENEHLLSSFIDLFNQRLISYSALIHNTKALKYILNRAIKKLAELRVENPNAGGLIVASSVYHAKMLQDIMRTGFGQEAKVVTYKQPEPVRVINDFKNSQAPWIISVGMISEGTDIPRLQVCCHLSRVKTELYFRQILGRILRVTNSPNNRAWLYTFAEPSLTDFAYRLQDEIPQQSILMQLSADFEQTGAAPKRNPNSNEASNVDSFPELDVNSNYSAFNTQAPDFDNTVASAKMELLGSFRDKVIATFN